MKELKIEELKTGEDLYVYAKEYYEKYDINFYVFSSFTQIKKDIINWMLENNYITKRIANEINYRYSYKKWFVNYNNDNCILKYGDEDDFVENKALQLFCDFLIEDYRLLDYIHYKLIISSYKSNRTRYRNKENAQEIILINDKEEKLYREEYNNIKQYTLEKMQIDLDEKYA